MVHHVIKQLQYITFGAATTWYFDLVKHIPELLSRGVTTFSGALTIISIILHQLAVVLFLYVLLYLPLVKGQFPDYSHWPENELANIVPWLTFGIIGGWTALFYTLWTYTPLSLWRSLLASLGFYALTLGVVGLVSTRPPPPKREGAENEKPEITSSHHHDD